MDKYFICLANSYKRGGRCIAGVEVIPDGNGKWKPILNDDGRPRWIRPIARTIYGEIPNFIAESIQLLSVVKLSDVVPCPKEAHIENVYYSQIKQCNNNLEPNLLNQLLDKKHQSIFCNRGRAVSAEMLVGINYSLMLIRLDKASAYIDENREKSKNRMKFSYYGVEYDFPITDPYFLEEFKKNPDRFSTLSNVYLALSLGLEFEGWHHKLVAGVIVPTSSAHSNSAEGVSYMEQQKQIHRNAYEKWTTDADEQLSKRYREGCSIQELCEFFGRNEGAIRSRINKLGLDNEITSPHVFNDGANYYASSKQNGPNWFSEYERELVRLLDMKNEIEEQINEVRAKILQGMETHGADKIHSEQFSVSYTPARTVLQFDSKTFRIENEKLYLSYCRPKEREASIVVKRNKLESENGE